MSENKADRNSYAEAYAELNRLAEKLRRGAPDDIDTLATDFSAAMRAYEACKSRLDRIRADVDAEIERSGINELS